MTEKETLKKPPKWIRAIIKKLRKGNIFLRLIMVFIVLVVTSTLFITIFNQKQYTNEVKKNTIENLTLLMQNASFKLEQEKTRMEKIITSFSNNETLRGAITDNMKLEKDDPHYINNKNFIEAYLLEIKEQNEGVKAAIFVSLDKNQYIMAKGHDTGRPYIRNIEAFTELDIYRDTLLYRGYPLWRDSTNLTSRIIFENETDKLGIIGTITLSSLIYNYGQKEPLGVLLLCIYPEFFTSCLSEYATTEGGNTFLVGRNGFIEGIGASFDGPPFPLERKQLIDIVFSKKTGSTILKENGETIFASYSGPEDFPIHILNLSYESTVLKGVKRLSFYNYMILLLVLTLGGFGFYLVAVSIAYPIRKLIASIHRVAKGDFNAMYKPQSNDEVGVLCKEFDRMVDETKDLIDKVYVQELKEKSLMLSAKNSELKALQMQINPHFLYNTLDLIRWQSIFSSGGENVVSDMIEKFAALLRQTIKGANETEPLKKSLEHAELYLEVVNFRFKNKIVLEKIIGEGTEDFLLPVFTLQPILENAIKHGFTAIPDEEKIIRVSCSRRENKMILSVMDNGIGMKDEDVVKLQEMIKSDVHGESGIGLWNVNQRLSLLYNDDYSFTIQSKEGSGTMITLLLPVNGEKNV